MGAVAGVLKLVHPGGFVETHRGPVRASEVMDRNPRHFVTRPDVFRFPWIVVRPESILNPGCVFYIVPCRALYRLLRSSGTTSSPMPPPHREAPVAPVGSRGGKTATCAADIGKFAKSCMKKPSCGSSKARDRRVAFRLPGGGGGDG